MRRHLAVALLRLSNAELWRQFSIASHAQWLERPALEHLRDQLIVDTLRQAVTDVPYYRDWAGRAGLPVDAITAGDLSRFPTVDKIILTAGRESHRAEGCDPADRMPSLTGGSSGVIFHFESDRRSKDARRAGDLLGRTWAGWRPGDQVAYVWGHTGDVSVAAGLRARVADKFMHRRDVLNAFDMDDTVISQYIRRLQRRQPELIIGYASSLAFLAGYMRRSGTSGIRPRGIISSAESLGPERRAIITEQFQCPVFDRYGSREFANVAQQCECGAGLHVFQDRVHVEVLRKDGTACDPGELGEITVTDLHNRVMPFIRYRTGDLAVPDDKPCACGRSLPVLASVHGRMSEIIVGANGKFYACPGPARLGADVPGVGQLQVIQSSLTQIEVRIVPNPSWNEESRQRIEAHMHQLLGDVTVTVTLVERIPLAASGKHQVVISAVSAFDLPGRVASGSDQH